jgi:hypothetical protein
MTAPVTPTFTLDPAPAAASTTTSTPPSPVPSVSPASAPTKGPIPTPNLFSETLESHLEILESHHEDHDPLPSRSPSPKRKDGPPWAPSMVPPLDPVLLHGLARTPVGPAHARRHHQ